MRDSATIVARGPLAWASLESTEPRRLWRFVAVALVTLSILSGARAELPYYALYPGGATAVNPLVGVPADRAHPATGRFLLTTVSLQSRPTVLLALQAWLDPDVDLIPEEQLLGDQTPDQFRQVNLQAIDDSKDVAVAVALRRLGFEVKQAGAGALVEGVVEGFPAASLLRPGDVIVAAGQEPVSLLEDVQKAVAARQPGDLLPLEVVDPAGVSRAVSVPIVPCPREGGCPLGATGIIGVTLRTRDLNFELPFEVHIESEDIGGPSAGLAFALTVIDLLTPGELTDGRVIAVTGEIGLDGTVGAIGGVGQKAAAVTDAGVEIFIVPAANAEEARDHAGENLQIVPVTDLESALLALGKLGGDLASLGAAP